MKEKLDIKYIWKILNCHSLHSEYTHIENIEFKKMTLSAEFTVILG